MKVLFLILANKEIRFQNTTHVRIKQGELVGTLESLSTGDSFASFKGIPYAKPPIGNLRFRVNILLTHL